MTGQIPIFYQPEIANAIQVLGQDLPEVQFIQ